jgi:tRNA-binding EMAP/Myf-like protein
VRSALEALYVAGHFLCPYIPNGCDALFKKLGTPPRPIWSLDPRMRNLGVGTKIAVGDVLFAKLEKKIEKAEEIFPCDMRVGTIDSLEEHPEQDTLFVCQVSGPSTSTIQA